MTEKQLNRLLRRADWRFLLPNPHPNRTICFANGLLQEAVEYISESTIHSSSSTTHPGSSTTHPGSSTSGQSCDLAVTANPDQQTLKDAWSSLSPGGPLYAEWDLGVFQNTTQIKKRLEQLGFQEIEFYLPLPSPDISPSTIWIPLDSKDATNYFMQLGSRDKRVNILRIIAKYLRRISWFLLPKLFMTYPILLNSSLRTFKVCSIAYKYETSQTVDPAINNIEDDPQVTPNHKKDLMNIVELGLKNLGVNKKPQNISTLLLTGGRHSSNKIISIVFTELDHEPAFIIKLPRISHSESVLEKEGNSLRTIQEKMGNTECIPRVLFSDHSLGFIREGQTYIGGVPLYTILTKRNFRDLALKTTEFLVNMAIKTKHTPPEDWQDKVVKPIVTDFVSSFGSLLNPELIKQTQEITDSIELPGLVWFHGDISPWNVLVNNSGQIGVIDWEDILLQGLPTIDLTYFLTYLSVYLEDAHEPNQFLESYRRMLDENTFTGAVYKECMDYYCTRADVPLSTLPSLRLLNLVNVINSKHYEYTHFEEKPPSAEALKNILHISLWEEELMRAQNQ